MVVFLLLCLLFGVNSVNFQPVEIECDNCEGNLPSATLFALQQKQQGSLVFLKTIAENDFIALEVFLNATSPHELSLSGGKFAVTTSVLDQPDPETDPFVDIIDLSTLEQTLIFLEPSCRTHGIIIVEEAFDLHFVLGTCEGYNRVVGEGTEDGALYWFTVSSAEVHTISTAPYGCHLLQCANQTRTCFCADRYTGHVLRINIQSEEVYAVYVGEGAEGLAITPNGRHLWVTVQGDSYAGVPSSVCVLELSSLQIVQCFYPGTNPMRVVFDALHSQAIVTYGADAGYVAFWDSVNNFTGPYEDAVPVEARALPLATCVEGAHVLSCVDWGAAETGYDPSQDGLAGVSVSGKWAIVSRNAVDKISFIQTDARSVVATLSGYTCPDGNYYLVTDPGKVNESSLFVLATLFGLLLACGVCVGCAMGCYRSHLRRKRRLQKEKDAIRMDGRFRRRRKSRKKKEYKTFD